LADAPDLGFVTSPSCVILSFVSKRTSANTNDHSRQPYSQHGVNRGLRFGSRVAPWRGVPGTPGELRIRPALGPQFWRLPLEGKGRHQGNKDSAVANRLLIDTAFIRPALLGTPTRFHSPVLGLLKGILIWSTKEIGELLSVSCDSPMKKCERP